MKEELEVFALPREEVRLIVVLEQRCHSVQLLVELVRLDLRSVGLDICRGGSHRHALEVSFYAMFLLVVRSCVL